jgi:prepilin-type N-terminal cleavage/methylation domain-containing protein
MDYSMKQYLSIRSGFSLIEILIVIAMLALVFGGLFVIFESSLRLIAHSKAKMSALSLSTDRLEYIRSLPYDSVGTILGIVPGPIPQTQTITLNDIDFTERVLVDYIDSPDDGLLAADTNTIHNDYKRVKIEHSWTIAGVTNTHTVVSTVVPRSIETDAGGGALRVNVFDANVNPLQGINVRLVNTTIDTMRQTDATGAVIFAGAPAGAGYEIFVSETGYSSEQTYKQNSLEVDNPTTLPVAILLADVSTMNFQIDRLSDVAVRLLSDRTTVESTETFTDFTNVPLFTTTAALAGQLVLESTAGVYSPSGDAWLLPLTPASIEHWGVFHFEPTKPNQTDARVQFYTSTNPIDLIDDSILPNNSIGFTGPYVDLSSLDGASYPTLVPRIVLSTANTAVTPAVDEVTISYVDTVTELANTNFTLRSTKSIGTRLDTSIVPKVLINSSTDGSGEQTLSDIEWGEYTLSIPGRTISEACPSNPFSVAPADLINVSVLTTAETAHNARVEIVDAAGVPVIGAAVSLSRPGYAVTTDTSWCGQSFFGGLVEAGDYELEVTAPGYTTNTTNPFSVSGVTVQKIMMTAI